MYDAQKTEACKWRVGQLVALVDPIHLNELHPFFVHPRQIWKGVSIFWNARARRDRRFQSMNANPSEIPRSHEEWYLALAVEYRSELGNDVVRPWEMHEGDVLMVLEVIPTPWKKKYRHAGGGAKRERFSYVKLMSTPDGANRPVFLFHDISADWATLLMDPLLFKVVG